MLSLIQIRLSSFAFVTALVRLSTSSFRKILFRCVLTVFIETNSFSAITWFDRFSAYESRIDEICIKDCYPVFGIKYQASGTFICIFTQ